MILLKIIAIFIVGMYFYERAKKSKSESKPINYWE